MASTSGLRPVDIQWRHYVSWGDYNVVWSRTMRAAQRYFNGVVPQNVLDGVIGRRPNQLPQDHVVEYPAERVQVEIENLQTRIRGNVHHIMRLKEIEASVARSPLGWAQFLPNACAHSDVPPPYSTEILSDSSPEPGPPAYTESRVSQDSVPSDAPPDYSP